MTASSDVGRLGTLDDPSQALGQQNDAPTLRTDGDDGPELGPNGGTTSVTAAISTDAPAISTDAPGTKHSLLYWLVDAHWLGRWRTPLMVKLWRYGAGSVVAFVSSVVVYYACFSWGHLGAIGSTWVAFVAGAVPNWILNRRWAWEKKGREGVAKESTLYVIVSVVSLIASSGTTKATALAVVHTSHTARDLLVTFSYMASVIVLSGLKYLVYDRYVFIDRSKSSTAVDTAATTGTSK
jgi:putative flippase GtrA